MKFCSILLFSCLFFSCKNQGKPSQSLIAPGIEEAETLVAKYYSARNREKNYPYYKGLGLEILSTKRIIGTDSFMIEVKVTGRKWTTPNKDTLTIPFEEIRNIPVIKNENGWQADSLSPR